MMVAAAEVSEACIGRSVKMKDAESTARAQSTSQNNQDHQIHEIERPLALF